MANKNEILQLLDELKEDQVFEPPKVHDRVMLLDAYNLFYRNFSILKMINPEGAHIGGLGGFIRSLGALIKKISPTSVYIIFDGQGSSDNRKNLIPEYKSGRDTQRVTNWGMFDTREDEDESKQDQLQRLIQYLKHLPVKLGVLDKVEADDIIATLSETLPEEYNSQVTIVSSDQDFLQLVNSKVVVYRPMEKRFYKIEDIKNRFGIIPQNFIIQKTLLGDGSDKIRGVKGLGPKKLLSKFPQLKDTNLSLDDIFEISEKNLKTHVIYARILQDRERLKTNYKIMDLSNPMIDDSGIKYVNNLIQKDIPQLNSKPFIQLYEEDQLGGMIRNVGFWLKDTFTKLDNYKK